MSTQHTQRLPKTFWWHNITQGAGAMNDNIFKLLMLYALIKWKGAEASAEVLATVGLVFALPFILIVPIAGNFADKFSKQSLIVKLKCLEIAIMGFGVFALAQQNALLLYSTMFLMSTQSAFFGPCKYGILPEQVGAEGLSKANGALQLFTFLAIIAGTVIAPELSLLAEDRFALAGTVCVVIAFVGLGSARMIQPTIGHPERKLSLNGFGSVFKTLLGLRKDGFMVLSILALTVFALAAAFIQLNILDYGFEHLSLSPEQSTRLFLLTAIGIGIGSATAGWLSGRSIEFGIVPIGAGLMGLSLYFLGTITPGHVTAAALSMLFLGFGAGLFIVPLEAFVQFRSPADRIGSIQAALSFSKWLGILLASGLLYLNSSVFEWSAQYGFFVLSISLLSLAAFSLYILPDFLMKFVGTVLTRSCYRLKVRGLEHLPAQGPALIVSNHVSMLDAFIIISSQQRRVRILMSREYYNQSNWITRKVVDVMNVILIHGKDNPKKLLQSLKTARKAMDEGYLVCIFAEGALTRTGMLRPFKPGFERIVKGTDYPIIPAYIGGAWNSVSSFRKGSPKLRMLSELRHRLSLQFGPHLPSSSSAFDVQQAVSELSCLSVDTAKEDKSRHLGRRFIQSARLNWSKRAIADSSGRELTYGELLTASLILRKRLNLKEKKVGILLPPGTAAAMSNLALALDNIVSVNLNYTASASNLRSAYAQCDLHTVISSRAFLERLGEPPMPQQVLYIEDLMKEVSQSEKRAAYLKARFLPTTQLINGKSTADSCATILFSSGSTAEPKGVMLSHHNLLSNIETFRSVLAPKRSDVVLTALPFFHSFGYTATFWFPLLSGITTVCHTNPLEAETIGKLAQKYSASILLTTPTFLLAYARKIKPEALSHLRYVFTGAEKLQPRVADLFEKRFGIRPLEGYGATELAPVCALSLPNVVVDRLEEVGTRDERLGRTLPGIAMKVIDPESHQTLPAGTEGLLCVKGPNVMLGYLGRDDLTAAAIKDGWYLTGDLGMMDEDRFFKITGRLSRFSKIGGEMIPHGAVEEALQQSFKLDPNQLSILAVPDERKGEKLCVLHSASGLDEATIRTKLQSIELPNLWKPNPKNWQEVEALPLLGSGKLDYPKMRSLLLNSKEDEQGNSLDG